MQAIETTFRGYRLRSRLEARWAVFFDALKLRWEYEKEGVKLPSGPYLPDFWMPGWDCWIEVKGQYPTDHEIQLCRELRSASECAVFLVYGPPGDNAVLAFCYERSEEGVGVSEHWLSLKHCSPNCYPWFWGIPEGSELFIDSGFKRQMHPWFDDVVDLIFEKACLAAKAARFEHGESPA